MAPIPDPSLPRIITYFQTLHTPSDTPISILPLLNPDISITHVILAAIHINPDPSALHLNDHPPSHPRYTTLWAELRHLQSRSVKVLAMLGGAAKGTYARLSSPDPSTFERYYTPLRDFLRDRALDGIDLDIEEDMLLVHVLRLIDRLRADFGPDFIITLAPVATALVNANANLSGFDYEALEVLRGKEIAWYNAQFYNGWGDMSSVFMYEVILQKGWPVDKIVVGLVTNPENGNGFIPWDFLQSVLRLLHGRYERFAGVMGWEYFNSLPGGPDRPWEWAMQLTSLLRSQHLSGTAALPGTDPHPKVELPRPFEYHSDEDGD